MAWMYICKFKRNTLSNLGALCPLGCLILI
nr:MAG TPA: hypothetical protein [Caudoviricetes sp.]